MSKNLVLGLVVDQVVRVIMDLKYSYSIFFPSAVIVSTFQGVLIFTSVSYYCAYLAMAHSILLDFINCWDIGLAAQNRGLPKEIGGCYDKFEFEVI